MGLLASFTKLFSSSEKVTASEECIEYNGYSITPTPQLDQGQYRVCATISKGEGDTQKHHRFIRSDLVPSYDQCVELTLRKAKLTIDQLGDQIF